METFICHPERNGPSPAVFLLMDAHGIREELKDMARRLGTVGYYVMLPNLYYRAGRDTIYGPDVQEEGSAEERPGHRHLIQQEGDPFARPPTPPDRRGEAQAHPARDEQRRVRERQRDRRDTRCGYSRGCVSKRSIVAEYDAARVAAGNRST